MAQVRADTPVRVRHFRRTDAVLQSLLDTHRIVGHALIVLELACGRPPAPRDRTLRDLRALPLALVATTEETLAFIGKERLRDSGCGAVDVVLPASTLLTPVTWLWLGGRRRPPSECVPCG